MNYELKKKNITGVGQAGGQELDKILLDSSVNQMKYSDLYTIAMFKSVKNIDNKLSFISSIIYIDKLNIAVTNNDILRLLDILSLIITFIGY